MHDQYERHRSDAIQCSCPVSALTTNLSYSKDDSHDWMVSFSHSGFDYLQSQIEPIADFYAATLGIEPGSVIGSFDESPTAEDEKGNKIALDPCIMLEYSGPMLETALAELHKGFKRLAKKAKINYEGVVTF